MASTSKSSSSEKNSSLIDQFCSVTGSNAEKAKKMLEVCGWNLEMAINMHVDSDYLETADPEQPVNGVEEGEIRAPIPQSRGVLMEEDLSFHYGLRGRKRRSRSVFDGFRDFRAEAELQEQRSGQMSTESLKKRRTLEDLFRPPLDLIHRGNFESARDFGQMSNKWMMVNLQDSQEFACQVLNRDVWSDVNVKKMINDNFVFWQVYSDSVDGERYIQFYKPIEFPYIAVLDPRTGEKLEVWHNVDSKSLCELINNFLKHHSLPDGSSTTSNAQETDFSLLDQSEEEQIKAALAASLKDSNNTSVEDNDSDLETFDSESNSPKQKPSSINANVHSDHSNDSIDVVGLTENDAEKSDKTWKDYLGNDDDPKSDLVLRLPDGKKEQISWPCSTKVECLLLYIHEIGYDPEKYELVTNYPRRNLCQLDLCKSLKEVDLFPREMIFVQLKS